MAERVIPFIGAPTGRVAGDSDQRYVNVYFEIQKNEALKEQNVYAIKRPGISSFSAPGGTSTGRGLYPWRGSTYSVFGHVLWTGTVSTAINSSTGRVWFTERPVDTGAQIVIASDGIMNYNITSTNVVSSVNAGTDADYPVSNLGPVVFMDGYIMQAQSNGRIWNSVLNASSAWAATGFLTADTHGGELEAIYMQKDQVVGLTKNRVEFFFNNGNPTGSPFLRIDQNTIYVGLASKDSLAWFGEVGCFVGENSEGGRAVYRLGSLKLGDISTPTINRFLIAEGLSISSCTAWMAPVNGQILYCLNLQAANKSFVYGVETGLWSEWRDTGASRFNCVSAAYRDGITYLQDTSSGQIYTVSSNTYTDKASTYSVYIQTQKSSFGTPKRKLERSLSLIGDQTTGNVSVIVSDDDFKTSTYMGTIDMNLQRKSVTRLGSFYERSHGFEYRDVSSFRVQAYAPDIEPTR